MAKKGAGHKGPQSDGPAVNGASTSFLKERWVGPVLTASVILNVFLAGFVVARLTHGSADSLPAAEAAPIQLSLRALPEDMPREVRERLEDELRDRQGELKDLYRDLQDAQRRAYEMMAQDDFDVSAVEEAFARVRALQEQIQAPMHTAIIDAARSMPLDSRDYLARRGIRSVDSQRLTESVDGGRWRFRLGDDRFELNLEALKELGLDELEDMEITINNGAEDGDEDWWDQEGYSYYYGTEDDEDVDWDDWNTDDEDDEDASDPDAPDSPQIPKAKDKDDNGAPDNDRGRNYPLL